MGRLSFPSRFDGPVAVGLDFIHAAPSTMSDLPPAPRDYEELRGRRVFCRPLTERPSSARACDPDTSKKRASGLHVLLLQAGQVA